MQERADGVEVGAGFADFADETVGGDEGFGDGRGGGKAACVDWAGKGAVGLVRWWFGTDGKVRCGVMRGERVRWRWRSGEVRVDTHIQFMLSAEGVAMVIDGTEW